MCLVSVNYKGQRGLSLSTSTRFFLVALTDGLGTTNEHIVTESVNPLAARLPLKVCMATHFFLPADCREFRKDQGLIGVASPLYSQKEDKARTLP